jgi:6-pyruvoyltetrahydropterin/6-carboxytetrahydropterin synthase
MAVLEFTRRYAMAHRLLAHPRDKCATPHGHNELVTVRLAPLAALSLTGDARLANFADVKRRWHGWIDGAVDHAFQVNAADPLIGYFRAHEPDRLERLMVFPGDPTTEALAVAFALKCEAFLSDARLPFALESVRIEETPTNAVEISAQVARDAGAAFTSQSWPRRADLSINDLGPTFAQASVSKA